MDVVVKVVGTRCFVALFMTPDNEPLLLQVKEASPSALEPYAGKSEYEREVWSPRGGWAAAYSILDGYISRFGRDFYVRQLRDMKVSFSFDEITATRLKSYSQYCGQALARSHAKSGNAAMILCYLGKSDVFDESASKFSVMYAKQNEKDYKKLLSAVRQHRSARLPK
jgi:hypothetical protein